MKAIVAITIVTSMMTILGGIVFSRSSFAGFVASAMFATKKDFPFACNRTALTPEERKRHFDELGPALRSRRQSVHELADGYEFEYPADPQTYQLLTDWIAGERVCCPFFDITMQVERGGGPIKLRLTGRDGVKKFIETEGVAWIKR